MRVFSSRNISTICCEIEFTAIVPWVKVRPGIISISQKQHGHMLRRKVNRFSPIAGNLGAICVEEMTWELQLIVFLLVIGAATYPLWTIIPLRSLKTL